MCYESDAVPPFCGSPLSVVATEAVVLTSADGAAFAGFLARPEDLKGVGVLVLPDNRGLSGFYEQFAVRLAEQGYTALAIDYFGRTAGLDHRARGEDFSRMENLMPHHLSKLTRDGLFGDFAAAIDILRNECRTVKSIGFCLGGRFAFQTAAARFGLSGVIGLYGYPGPLNGTLGPTQEAAEYTAPILALWGGADEGIPQDAVIAFEEALVNAGVEHEFVTYPGAPHGFFEMRAADFEEACADVWRRVLDFLAR